MITTLNTSPSGSGGSTSGGSGISMTTIILALGAIGVAYYFYNESKKEEVQK